MGKYNNNNNADFEASFNQGLRYTEDLLELLNQATILCLRGDLNGYRERLFAMERRIFPLYKGKKDLVQEFEDLKKQLNEAYEERDNILKESTEYVSLMEEPGQNKEQKRKLRASRGKINRILNKIEKFILCTGQSIGLLVPEKTSSSYFGN